MNSVTCHGFTLNDIVSYNLKHNESIGENNNDGSNKNYSLNYGVESPSESLEIDGFRMQNATDQKLHLDTSHFKRTLMLLMGDEIRRTPKGNNNSYCQNNELSWLDWMLVKKNKDLFSLTSNMIALLLDLNFSNSKKFLTPRDQFWSPQ